MITLKELYSETGLFDKVEFHSGINIVKGEYDISSKKEKGLLNSIGKSTLIRLIDFALLSDAIAEDKTRYFDVKKYTFLKDHSVTLKFSINDKIFFVRRLFNTPRNIEFGADIKKLEEYKIEELRTIFGDLFFGKDDYDGMFKTSWFRTLMNFFIKDDINHFERADPLKFEKNLDIFESYVYNLFLLNLPNKNVYNYDMLQRDSDKLSDRKQALESDIKTKTGKSIEEIISEIRIIDKRVESLQKAEENYKFAETYKDSERDIVILTNKISRLLASLTPIERRLNEYEKSHEYEIEIDVDRVSKIYHEVREIFGESVKKELEQVLLFRKRLAENREKFLNDKEIELRKEIEEIKNQISVIENERSKIYELLNEKNALDSIKNTYAKLIEEKITKENLKNNIEEISNIDEKLMTNNNLITETISLISKDIKSVSKKIDSISTSFIEMVKEITSIEHAERIIFDIRASSKINSPLRITIDVPESKGLGKKRFKLPAYDLAVFFNIIKDKRKLPYFLIHDGVFHAIDKKLLVKTLNFVNSKTLELPEFQYIITANEYELEIPDNKKDIYGEFNFSIESSVIARYTPTKKIFKRDY